MYMIMNWLLSALAIILTSLVVPGVTLGGLWPALVTALVLGLLNAIIRPILIILTLPITIVTLGLFTLVINAGLVLLASSVVKGFDVHGFWHAVIFSIVLFFISLILNQLKPKNHAGYSASI